MTFTFWMAVGEALVIVGGIFYAYALLDKLDAERRHARGWKEEAEFWQQRARRGVWHTCGCRKEHGHDRPAA